MQYKIFVSHAWRAQNDYYHGLIKLLDQANRFEVIDLSVPRIRQLDGDDNRVRRKIFRVLKTADVVLIVNTPVVSTSPFVQAELNLAERHGVPIVAINPPKRHGMTRKSLFPPMTRAYPAQWTTKSIVGAIKKAVKEKPRPASTASKPVIEVPYEPIAVAVAEEPMTSAERKEVRGDDEDGISAAVVAMPISGELPKDVLYKSKENTPQVAPKRWWLSRILHR